MNTLKQIELLKLLGQYDKYIQTANEENYYKNGWFPACIEEFYNNEFQEGLYNE